MLVPVLMVLYPGIILHCHCILDYFPLSLLSGIVSLYLCLISFIHLDLSFVQGDRYGSICILLYTDIQLDEHYLLKILSFLHCVFWALSNIKWPFVKFCMHLQLDSVYQCVHFYTNIIFLLLLYFFKIFKIREDNISESLGLFIDIWDFFPTSSWVLLIQVL